MVSGLRPKAYKGKPGLNDTDWQQDDRQIVAFYSELVNKYGNDHRSADWGSRSSQEMRFAVFAQIAVLDGCRILDIGCGLADFYGWLKSAEISVDYTGIDLTPDMINMARARYPEITLQTADFCKDISDRANQFDYVFASGIFYLRKFEPYEYLEIVAAKMLKICSKAAAFNSLSAWHQPPGGAEFWADPINVISICASLTTRIAFRHDYLPNDFTVYLFHK